MKETKLKLEWKCAATEMRCLLGSAPLHHMGTPYYNSPAAFLKLHFKLDSRPPYKYLHTHLHS